MLGYLSLDIICSFMLTVFLKPRSWKFVCFSEQIMSMDKYPSIFSRQMEVIVCVYIGIYLINKDLQLMYQEKGHTLTMYRCIVWSRNTTGICQHKLKNLQNKSHKPKFLDESFKWNFLTGWWGLNQGILSEDYRYVMEQCNENSLTTFSHLLKDSEATPKMATSFTPQSS